MRLNLRNKRKRRLPARVKAPLLRPIYPNVTWRLDFMHDTLANGKTLRTLNIIDDFNREVLTITVDTSLPSQRVIRELETLAEAFEKGYLLGRSDGREGIFIDMPSLVSEYRDTLATEIWPDKKIL